LDLSAVDRSATLGRSALNRADPVPKLVAFALVLGATVASTNLLLVLSIAAVLLAVMLAARLPAGTMIVLALYPGLFALIFAFAAGADLLSGALLVARAVTAAAAAVLLMFTTPYPQVFAPVQRVVPEVVGDALLMTYRSLFLLLELFGRLVRAVRLRAGALYGRPARSLRLLAPAFGVLVLDTVDLSIRTAEVMRLRGYERRLVAMLPSGRAPVTDVVVVATALAITGLAVVWRVWWPVLNPVSWIPFAAAVAGLFAAAVYRLLARPTTGPRSGVRT
jgi:energy-coupling factor transporter transmembrane protein EcfT